MKRMLKMMLAAVLALSMLVCFAGAEDIADTENVIGTHATEDALNGFEDAPSADSWKYQGLNCAAENEIMVGHEGLIRPDDSLTRAELVTMMVRVLGAEGLSADLSKFSDIEANAWYYDSISSGVAIKIINGSEDKMMPKDAITREQTFAILARTFVLIQEDANSMNSFDDASSVSAWAKNATNALIEAEVVLGDAKNTLRPKANVTRAEFAAMLDRIVCFYAKADVDYSGKVIDGSVIIRDSGVDLSGAVINGDVYVVEAIGEDSVDLSDVTVNGRVVVRSGDVTVAEGDEDKVVTPEDMPEEETPGDEPVVTPPVDDGKNDSDASDSPNVSSTPSRPSGPAAVIGEGTYITYSYDGSPVEKYYADVNNNSVTFDFGALLSEIASANGGEVDTAKLIFKNLYVESNKRALCKHPLVSFYTNEENNLAEMLVRIAGATNNVLVPIENEDGTSYIELCDKMVVADAGYAILPELFEELSIYVASDEDATFSGYVGSADFKFRLMVDQPRG